MAPKSYELSVPLACLSRTADKRSALTPTTRLRQKSSGLADRTVTVTVTEQLVPARPPKVPQGPVPLGFLAVSPAQLGVGSDCGLGQVRGRIALSCNHRCAKAAPPRSSWQVKQGKVSWLKEKLDLSRVICS